jgi:hypothetical protein
MTKKIFQFQNSNRLVFLEAQALVTAGSLLVLTSTRVELNLKVRGQMRTKTSGEKGKTREVAWHEEGETKRAKKRCPYN